MERFYVYYGVLTEFIYIFGNFHACNKNYFLFARTERGKSIIIFYTVSYQ